MSEITLHKNIPIESNENSIVFISDLHFDHTKGKFKAKAAQQIKDDFITFAKDRYVDSILCLAGDFFNDYRKTLSFVKELEQNKIVGFFVLGNHDFWNNGTKSHTDIISLFNKETQGNQYFKFLITGRKYYLKDICFIGDTGWTSFRRGKRRVALKQFMDFPDAIKVKDFSPKKVIAMHEEWVSFANGVLNQEEKVLILTHFPMVDFTKEDIDCWWSSQTDLKGENSWRIFGHTHKRTQKYKEKQDNNVSSQRGYDNWGRENFQNIESNQYSSRDFGKLEKLNIRSNLIMSTNYEIISKFYSPILVSNATNKLEMVSAVKGRGYKRCSANRYNFAFLASSPTAYIERVKQVISGYLKDTYIGYIYSDNLSKKVVESIFSSISILEEGSTKDIKAFITAAVITGYVFNGMPFLIENMRPLDDYDIIRFWLMFLTIKQYGINVDSIYSVCRHRKNLITFCDVDIYLPAVNGLALSVNEVQELMQQTPLLPRPAAFLE